MLKKVLLTLTVLLFAAGAVAQEELTPEEACKQGGDYWSDDLSQCFLVADMDGDEVLLFRQINAWLAEKDRLQHEHNENQPAAKSAAVASYNARIASLTGKRDATADDEVKEIYQAEIDRLTSERDARADKEVNHGQAISDLSRKIGKTKEELDSLLTQ